MRAVAVLPLGFGWILGCGFDTTGTYTQTGAPDARLPNADATVDTRPLDAPLADRSDVVDALDATPPQDAAVGFCNRQDSDLRLCLTFNNPEHLDWDESQYENHLWAYLLKATQGIEGFAGLFDNGTSAMIREEPSLDLQAVTIEMWVQRHEQIPVAGRFGLLDNEGQYGMFIVSGRKLLCTMGGVQLLSKSEVKRDVWTHVACVSDGSSLHVYVNGKREADGFLPNGISTAGDKGTNVGKNSPDGDQLKGAIDNLRVFSRARTPEEICAAANCK